MWIRFTDVYLSGKYVNLLYGRVNLGSAASQKYMRGKATQNCFLVLKHFFWIFSLNCANLQRPKKVRFRMFNSNILERLYKDFQLFFLQKCKVRPKKFKQKGFLFSCFFVFALRSERNGGACAAVEWRAEGENKKKQLKRKPFCLNFFGRTLNFCQKNNWKSIWTQILTPIIGTKNVEFV